MIKRHILLTAIAAALVIPASSFADDDDDYSSFDFDPIESSADAVDWDPTNPWSLPEGFAQTVVSDETDLNIYDGGRNDWHDMNNVNETGKMAGRFMYRTHELRLPDSLPEGGSVSVVDLKTGVTKLLAQNSDWNALDGIRWTPWGTILFAEESYEGRLFEIVLDKHDLMTAVDVIDRPAVGRLAHEGIDLDTDGNIYGWTSIGVVHPAVTVWCPVAAVSTSSYRISRGISPQAPCTPLKSPAPTVSAKANGWVPSTL